MIEMHVDVLIIGAGVLGLSSAYHIKRRNPKKNILVIDKLSGSGQGNTAKSAGGFRNVLASEKNRLLAESTINWFYNLQNNLGFDLNLAQIGYLWLLSKTQHKKLKSTLGKMRRKGIELKSFEKRSLEQKIPELVTGIKYESEELTDLDSIDIGILGVKCGTVNTDALARSYESLFLKLGGETRYNTEAIRLVLKPEKELGIPDEPFVWQDLKVIGAKTNIGDIEAETTVIAAGVWSETLLDPIGFDSMMKPKKRVIFVFKDPRLQSLFDVKGFNKYDTLPLHTSQT